MQFYVTSRWKRTTAQFSFGLRILCEERIVDCDKLRKSDYVLLRTESFAHVCDDVMECIVKWFTQVQSA